MTWNKEIFVINDDRLVLATLAQGLENAGYSVSTAESVSEAECFLKKNNLPPKLAIIDEQLPGGNGLALAKWLQENTEIPFILLTAISDTEQVNTAISYGALAYLVKPLSMSQLLPSIEAAMARGEEITALRETKSQLQAALNADRDINVAVGIIMVQQHQCRKYAFELLRKTARNQRRKLAALAKDIVCASEILSKLKK